MNMKKIGLGSIAAAGAAALVMGLGTPAMAAVSPTLNGVSVAGPASVTLPKTGNVDVPLSVAFNGPTANNIYYSTSTSSKLIAKNSKIKASYVWTAPSVYQTDYNQPVTPTAAKAYKMSVYSNITTPGKYRVTATVKKSQYGTADQSASGYKDITVKANTGFSKARTYVTGNPKYGRAFKVKVNAPYYQVGAKVTAYVKLAGKKKYKKVTSGYLKSSTSSTSKASLKIPSKYNKNKARFYFKVAAAPYAGSYKTTTYKITVRRY